MRFSDYIGLARRHMGAVIGCVILGLICWVGSQHLAARLGTTRELAKLATVMVPLCLGGVGFVASCAVLKTEELGSAWRLVMRRGRSRR